jgi:UDP-glucose 4-epimerase
MNVAVIGANGFIGRHLVELLSTNPDINLSLFGRSSHSSFKNYQRIDLNDKKFIGDHFKNIDYVFYLASESIPANSWDKPMFEIEKNLVPFINFLECVSSIGVKKVGFLSSAGTVYGESSAAMEEESNKHPFSPYGITKLAMENFLNYFRHKNGLSYDIFRVSNVYGEGQDTSKGLGLINTLMENIIKYKRITVYGNGDNIRNYIYVKDVASLLAQMLTLDHKELNILNIASNDTLSINAIVEILRKELKQEFTVDKKEHRGSDNKAIRISNDKLKKKFPQFNFTPIQEGIKATYAHIKAHTQSNK